MVRGKRRTIRYVRLVQQFRKNLVELYIYIAKMVHGPSNAKLRKYVFAKSNLVVLEVLHLLNANTSSSGTAIAGRLSKFSVGISLSLILRLILRAESDNFETNLDSLEGPEYAKSEV